MANFEKPAMVTAGIGALNWGLDKFLNYNVVDRLLGSMPLVVNIVYAAIGIAGIMVLVKAFK